MSDSVQFSSFYRLLREVRDGDEAKNKELQWILAEYEHSKDATSAYDELGQIFCHHGVMELYDYTGVDNINYINTLNSSVWSYLKIRMDIGLLEYMCNSMINHAKEHNLAKKISGKWKTPIEDIEENMNDLAKYVAEGIIELVQ